MASALITLVSAMLIVAPMQANNRSRKVAPARIGTKRRNAMLSLGTRGTLRCSQCRRSHGFESQTNSNICGRGEYYCGTGLCVRRQRLVLFKSRQSLGAELLKLSLKRRFFLVKISVLSPWPPLVKQYPMTRTWSCPTYR